MVISLLLALSLKFNMLVVVAFCCLVMVNLALSLVIGSVARLHGALDMFGFVYLFCVNVLVFAQLC